MSEKRTYKTIKPLTIVALVASIVAGFVIFLKKKPEKLQYEPDPSVNLKEWATQLYDNLAGINIPTWGWTDRAVLFQALTFLTDNNLRGLNNYWIEHFDPEVSVYGWINSEYTIPGTEEDIYKHELLKALLKAGINPNAGGSFWF